MPRKLTAWNLHAQKVYRAGRKQNPEYKFSQALKDATKTYIKQSQNGGKRKVRRRSRRTRRSRNTSRRSRRSRRTPRRRRRSRKSTRRSRR